MEWKEGDKQLADLQTLQVGNWWTVTSKRLQEVKNAQNKTKF